MIGWAAETLIATSVLMLIVLIIRAPVRAAMGPRFAYALWALPALRMILPPLPGDWRWSHLLAPAVEPLQSTGMVMGIIAPGSLADGMDHAAMNGTITGGESFIVVPPVVVDGGAPVIAILAGIWALGAAAFLLYHLGAHRAFCRRILSNARVARPIADGHVQMVESPGVAGPMAFGIIRKYVAFPHDFAERYDRTERDLALAHELCHHARGDIYSNWAALAVLALNWFNPIAWTAFRAFRADQEMACDAAVLANRSPAVRHAYGRVIAKSAGGAAISAACHLHSIKDIKGRLKMLSRNLKISRKRLLAGSAGTALLMLGALGMTASGTRAAETLRGTIKSQTGISLADSKPLNVQVRQQPTTPAAPQEASPTSLPELAKLPTAPAEPRVIAIPEGTSGHGVYMSKGNAYVAQEGDLANIPEIRHADCGISGEQSAEIVQSRANPGGRDVMTLCTDRIEKLAKEVGRMAGQTKTVELKGALAGLHAGRASLEVQRNLSEQARAKALAGIDESIAELQEQLDESN